MSKDDILDAMEEEIPHLRRYARALTRDAVNSDDLVQDALERAISRMHRFREGTNLRSWLFTVMHNVHIDQCRKAKRQGVKIPLEDWTRDTEQEPTQPWASEIRDFSRNFKRLRKSEQDVLTLVGLEGLKYEEAADRLNVAIGTVKSRLFRARENLKQMGSSAHLS